MRRKKVSVGREIIETILENMRQHVEELCYSKIVPAAYDVYLHDQDEQRLKGLARLIVAEAEQRLDEELDRLNRPSRLDRVRRLIGPPVPHRKVGPWVIRITRDHERKVEPGEVLVVSQPVLPEAETYEGSPTQRIATTRGPRGFETRAETAPSAPARPESTPAATATGTRLLATLSWEDGRGPCRYHMEKDEIVVGREAPTSAADVRIETEAEVSRDHLRIRFGGGRFSVENRGQNGTTLNGQPVPLGREQELPERAELRLADLVTLRFRSEVQR